MRIAILLIGCLLLVACSECPSGLKDAAGECCENVCAIKCEYGVMPGTCGCACNEPLSSDVGLDVFDDGTEVAPPPLPT